MDVVDDILNEKPNETENWKDKKTSERKELNAMVDYMIAGIGSDSSVFMRYLETQSHFDRYSVTNTLLIQRQNKDAVQLKQSVYKQYGTTLLGLLLTSEFVFAFQLGDGDIMYINAEKTESIIEPEKILGIETHSLCKDDAWKKTETFFSLRNNIDSECLYLLSTDGFSNSHKTSHDFYLTCKEYLTMIKAYGFDTVSANLKSWLKETSKLGCGDDITVVMCYCK